MSLSLDCSFQDYQLIYFWRKWKLILSYWKKQRTSIHWYYICYSGKKWTLQVLTRISPASLKKYSSLQSPHRTGTRVLLHSNNQRKKALITTSCWLISTSLLFVPRHTLWVSSSTEFPWSSPSFDWGILPLSHYMFVFLLLQTKPYLFGTSVVTYSKKTDRLQDFLHYFEMTAAYLGSPTLPSHHSALLYLVFLLHFLQSGLQLIPSPSAFAIKQQIFLL